jgi:heat shock protein HslJ
MLRSSGNRLIISAIGLLIVVGVVAWLLPGAMSSAAAPELEGRTWRLTSANGQPAAPGSAATISFSAGKVAGSTGVNQFGGSYRAGGGSLTLSDLAATLMASADPALNAQEQAILGVLQGQLTYRVSGAQLTLSSAGGTLVYTA